MESRIDPNYESSHPVAEQIQNLFKKAVCNGLQEPYATQLHELLTEFEDIFRVGMTNDDSAKVPPMRIKLEEGTTPFRTKVRRYPKEQAQFLKKTVDKLVKLGMVKRNTESAWACAPLIVPKPGSKDKWRFTVDLRPVNKATVPSVWPMPDLETQLSRLAGMEYFATVDLCHMYWQFPLEEDSQECQSFITPDGVYTPTRVLQGQRNAVTYCQSTMQSICQEIIERLLGWLDDMLFFSKTIEELLQTLRLFFIICKKHNLKIHAEKCDFFLKKVQWCGRVVSSEGVQLNPRKLNALLELQAPKSAADLQQFLCAANWMRC